MDISLVKKLCDKSKEHTMSKPLTNKEILEALNKRVYGHENAKKQLINAINRSKKRYYQECGTNTPEDELVPLLNCFLIGSSGTGKTFLLEELSRIMDFPLVKFDASQLNPIANRGGISYEDIIRGVKNNAKLLYESKDNNGRYFSEKGIIKQTVVFLDEFDKVGISCYTDRGWGEKTYAELLTLIENKGELDGVTYIFAGAFSKLTMSGAKPNSIGFGKLAPDNDGRKDLISLENMDKQIMAAGVPAEMLGRCGAVILLDEFEKKDYLELAKRILLPKFYKDLKILGILDYELTDDRLDKIVDSAMRSGLGIRAMHRGLSSIISDLEFEVDGSLKLDTTPRSLVPLPQSKDKSIGGNAIFLPDWVSQENDYEIGYQHGWEDGYSDGYKDGFLDDEDEDE